MGVKEVRERHGAVETSLPDGTSTFRARCVPSLPTPTDCRVALERRGSGPGRGARLALLLGTVAELSGSLRTVSWLLAGECLEGGGWEWEVGGGVLVSL